MKELIVLSGKGGTGKTSVSAAFATIQQNSLIADCDVDAANMYLILQPYNYHEEVYISAYRAQIIEDKCKKCQKCMVNCRFDAIHIKENKIVVDKDFCEGCGLCERVCARNAIEMIPSDKSRWYLGKYRNGFLVHARLAPGEENSGKLVSVVREETKKIARDKAIDVIIIDGPPGIGCPVISSVTGTDKALVVTEPTNSGFHDLKRIVKLVHDFQVSISVLINKYDLNKEISDKIELWCQEENIDVITKLPFDKKVVDAMLNCKSIIEYDPEGEISQKLKMVYKKLIG